MRHPAFPKPKSKSGNTIPEKPKFDFMKFLQNISGRRKSSDRKLLIEANHHHLTNPKEVEQVLKTVPENSEEHTALQKIYFSLVHKNNTRPAHGYHG